MGYRSLAQNMLVTKIVDMEYVGYMDEYSQKEVVRNDENVKLRHGSAGAA